jgi:hypothetical protein
MTPKRAVVGEAFATSAEEGLVFVATMRFKLFDVREGFVAAGGGALSGFIGKHSDISLITTDSMVSFVARHTYRVSEFPISEYRATHKLASAARSGLF